MIIRHIKESDAAAVAEIYSYYVENTAYSFEYDAPGECEIANRIRDTVKFHPYLVCEENGEILGYAYAHRFRERRAYQWICELSVYVKNSAVRRGVAAMLYAKIIPILKKQGFLRAIAVVSTPNDASEAFHRAMGFTLTAVMPRMGYKFGGWHDLKYYEIELNRTPEGTPDEPTPHSTSEN